MIVEMNVLDRHSQLIDSTIPADEIDLASDDAVMIGPVHLKCEVSRDGFSVSVVGTIDAKLEIECSRCLTAVEFSPPPGFQVEFVEKEHFGIEGEHEIGGRNLSVGVLDDEFLDLNAIVREQLLLNLPEQIFCRKDCKGLCENCEANRNLKVCICTNAETDPRWSALKELKLPQVGND